MKKHYINYLLIGVCIFMYHLSNGQIVNNKLNLYFSYGLAAPLGETNVQEENFVNPAILGNMQQGQAFSVIGTYQIKPFLSTGLMVGFNDFSDWGHPGGALKYDGAGMQILSVAPVIRIHTNPGKQGFFNRIHFFAECNPGFSQVKTTLKNPLFIVQPVDGPEDVFIETLVQSRKVFPGIQGVVGGECVLGDGWGVAARLGYHHLWTEDILYTEKTLSFLTIQAGLFLRMMHEKRFYY